jgi:hypothetical protein
MSTAANDIERSYMQASSRDTPVNGSRSQATRTLRRYARVLKAAIRSSAPFLIGGGYAFEYFTGIHRRTTKDLDLFIRRRDVPGFLRAMEAGGFRTQLMFPHWLAKIHVGEDWIDLIWSSGNGVAVVDDRWFEWSVPTALLGCPVRLCPPEEMMWSKAFVMERERYDGADITHLLRACHAKLDWRRLVDRFSDNWRVLYSHLVLFGFIYPGERGAVPAWVLHELGERLAAESRDGSGPDRICRGTLLSRAQYLTDVQHWGYVDARLDPHGTMTPADVDRWTRAIADDTDEDVDHAHCGGG